MTEQNPYFAAEQIGELRGRMSALEGRVDRDVGTVRSELAGLNDKMDEVRTTLATMAGGRQGAGVVFKGVQWVLVSVAGVIGFLIQHFFSQAGK